MRIRCSQGLWRINGFPPFPSSLIMSVTNLVEMDISHIDWCHLVDRHRPTAWDTTRKLVVPQAVKLNFETLNDFNANK
ncbi:hypothetical protein TYRP_014831 [Tyrophagus putrescentiae]|nr:hypothetical protein TYRP_014831 [Tyrophagus putrescentiae]